MSRAARELIKLELEIGWARWRSAWNRGPGPLATTAGWSGELVTLTISAIAATVLAVVVAELVSTLATRGEATLACGIAGAFTDLSILLAAVAVVITDGHRGGLDPRPLSLLPLRRFDIALAEAAVLACWHPAALVSLTFLAGLGVGSALCSADTFWSFLPALLSAALCCTLTALALRMLWFELAPERRARAWGGALRSLLVLLPLMVLVADERRLSDWIRSYESSWTPGGQVATALRAGLAGAAPQIRSLTALLLTALGLFVVAWRWRWPRRWGLGPVRIGRWRFVAWSRVWGLPRAFPLLTQALAMTLIVALIGLLLQRRGMAREITALTVMTLAAWLLASAAAPLCSNALGLGGGVGASAGLLPHGFMRELLRTQWSLFSLPLVLLLPLMLLLALLLGAPGAALLATSCGVVQLLLGVGIGSACSVLWPAPLPLERESDRLWGPGPARLIMPAAQSAGLLPAVMAFADPEGVSQSRALSSLAISLCVACLGFGFSVWYLRRSSSRVAERLLA